MSDPAQVGGDLSHNSLPFFRDNLEESVRVGAAGIISLATDVASVTLIGSRVEQLVLPRLELVRQKYERLLVFFLHGNSTVQYSTVLITH